MKTHQYGCLLILFLCFGKALAVDEYGLCFFPKDSATPILAFEYDAPYIPELSFGRFSDTVVRMYKINKDFSLSLIMDHKTAHRHREYGVINSLKTYVAWRVDGRSFDILMQYYYNEGMEESKHILGNTTDKELKYITSTINGFVYNTETPEAVTGPANCQIFRTGEARAAARAKQIESFRNNLKPEPEDTHSCTISTKKVLMALGFGALIAYYCMN